VTEGAPAREDARLPPAATVTIQGTEPEDVQGVPKGTKEQDLGSQIYQYGTRFVNAFSREVPIVVGGCFEASPPAPDSTHLSA
jgi:hypothetical protein